VFGKKKQAWLQVGDRGGLGIDAFITIKLPKMQPTLNKYGLLRGWSLNRGDCLKKFHCVLRIPHFISRYFFKFFTDAEKFIARKQTRTSRIELPNSYE
jgi:hypothetical protein